MSTASVSTRRTPRVPCQSGNKTPEFFILNQALTSKTVFMRNLNSAGPVIRTDAGGCRAENKRQFRTWGKRTVQIITHRILLSFESCPRRTVY